MKRLADAVLAVREDLGLTQDEFAQRGDLSIITVQRIEGAKVTPRTKTFKGLDKAVKAPSGTARSIYEGRLERFPSQDVEQPTPTGPPTWLRDDPVEHQLWAITELPEADRRNYILQWRAKLEAEGSGLPQTG